MLDMNRIAKRVFDDTMRQEGKKAITFYGSQEFSCFFRKNNDGISQRDTIIMFYGLDAPVKAGTIIVFRGEKYIALNKETVENDIYYKSTLIKTNGEITSDDFSVVGLPFYGDDINSTGADNGTNISVINGKSDVITEDCETSRKLKINNNYNAWGRTWQIENIYYIDGIAHIVSQVTADMPIEHAYTLSLDTINVDTVKIGDTFQLNATAYCDGVEDTTAELAWESSDNDVATIDGDGNVIFTGAGNVSFSVTWAVHGLKETTQTIECVEEIPPEEINLYVATVGELYCDFENEKIEYYVTKGGEKVTDIPITFTAEYPESAAIQKNIKIETYTDYVIVNPEDTRLLSKTFTLVATNAEYNLENRQEIRCISIW